MLSSQELRKKDLRYYTENMNAQKKVFKLLYKGTKRSDLIPQFTLWQKGKLSIDEKFQDEDKQPADEIFKLWYNKYQNETKHYEVLKTELQEFIQKENISLNIDGIKFHYEKKITEIKIELERLEKVKNEINKNYEAFCESREIYEVGGKLCSTIIGIPIGIRVLLAYAFIDACYTFYSTLKSIYIHDQISQQQKNHLEETNAFKNLIKFSNGFFKCGKYQKLCDLEIKNNLDFSSLDNKLRL